MLPKKKHCQVRSVGWMSFWKNFKAPPTPTKALKSVCRLTFWTDVWRHRRKWDKPISKGLRWKSVVDDVTGGRQPGLYFKGQCGRIKFKCHASNVNPVDGLMGTHRIFFLFLVSSGIWRHLTVHLIIVLIPEKERERLDCSGFKPSPLT